MGADILSRRAGIWAQGPERGYRTLVIARNGGKVVTIPLAPRAARVIGVAIGERCRCGLLGYMGG
jgi:hypothetical protein